VKKVFGALFVDGVVGEDEANAANNQTNQEASIAAPGVSSAISEQRENNGGGDQSSISIPEDIKLGQRVDSSDDSSDVSDQANASAASDQVGEDVAVTIQSGVSDKKDVSGINNGDFSYDDNTEKDYEDVEVEEQVNGNVKQKVSDNYKHLICLHQEDFNVKIILFCLI
jgi:hypothetical protein